ncbi:MAG: hypothetical protein ABSF63_14420 [Candidatus Bathyarchaeia archaeon]|jgi:hypothetical protein
MGAENNVQLPFFSPDLAACVGASGGNRTSTVETSRARIAQSNRALLAMELGMGAEKNVRFPYF